MQLILFAFLEQEKAPPKGSQNFPLFFFVDVHLIILLHEHHETMFLLQTIYRVNW